MNRRASSPGPPPFAGAAPSLSSLAEELDELVRRYERTDFIAQDPIAIPHAFDDPLDREVIGMFAALLAWGRRSTLLANLENLVDRMRSRPAAFVMDFDAGRDASRLTGFRHRTFGAEDAISLTLSLQATIRRHGSVGSAFGAHLPADAADIAPAIEGLSTTLLTIVPGTPARMAKHLARPSTGSACKRLAMYARWMIRPGPVDLGLWTCARPDQLVLPLDVHTGRQARRLGLLLRPHDDWRAVQELTAACRSLDPSDPARYDFALFGLGAYGGEVLEG